MKVLLLLPRFPLPQDDGGKIAMYQMFKNLIAADCELTLFSYYNENINPKYFEEINSLAKLILFKKNTSNSIFNILKFAFNKNSLFVSKYQDQKVEKMLVEYVQQNKIDIIQGEHVSMAFLAYRIRLQTGVKFTHRIHNVEFMIWKRYAETKSKFSLSYVFLQSQSNKLKKDEAQIIKAASLNITISPKENEILKDEFKNSNFLLFLPNIDFTNIQISSFESKQKNVFMHATTFNWVHNIDAITWYINKVQTIVFKSNPNAKLWIFGKNAPEEFSNYTGIGVELKGYVDSIAEYYHKSLFYIAPLFVGSGIRIKIIEAMSYGLPVIASSISAEGISELAGEDDGLFICDNEQDFANKVIELLADPKRTYQLGLNARKFAEKHFDFNKNIGLLINKYNEIINTKN
jgi:glycosyltransferase involved in cell wall biosynthesis